MRVLKARFRTKEDFLEAYSEDHPHGGIFCATTEALEVDEAVVVELHFPELPNKMLLSAKVVSWRAAVPRLRVRAGAQVAFDEAQKSKVGFVLERVAGQWEGAVKRKHARLPVEIEVQWKLASTADSNAASLREISIGGGQLVTEATLEIGDDLVVDMTVPGGSHPFSIASKVTYRTPNGYGLRFIYRDGGGSRRLREMVRRLVKS
jgi:Tfp pilus assembly protein PilZ